MLLALLASKRGSSSSSSSARLFSARFASWAASGSSNSSSSSSSVGGGGDDSDDDDDGENGKHGGNTPEDDEGLPDAHSSSSSSSSQPKQPSASQPHEDAPQVIGMSEGLPARIGQGDEAPRKPHVLVLPVAPRPVFPGTIHPVNVFDPALAKMLAKLQRSGSPYLGLFLLRPEALKTPPTGGKFPDTVDSIADVYPVGSFASIMNMRPVADGVQMLVLSHRRIRITSEVTDAKPLAAKVSHLRDVATERNSGSATVKAYQNELLATMRDILQTSSVLREFVSAYSARLDVRDPFKLADMALSIVSASTLQEGVVLQEAMEAMDLEQRLHKSLVLLKKERELARVQQDLQKQVEEKLSQQQRKYFLMEQLKTIKKELGLEKDDKEALMSKFTERLSKLPELPKDAKQAVDEEMEKLSSLEKNSSEFNVTRNYLDWLTSLPWGKKSTDNLDVRTAREQLNKDHYGLTDIKDRILEFIAVSNLRGSVDGKILCFVGPPGVGKTSIGKSIAKALNREFYRFSVGGLTDVSEIKGHRRTYVGAMPGKVIQSLKLCGTSNPVVLIDEVDKLGRGLHGDPASALLELLDPSQNATFVDHYLDVPVNLSSVLFICTANVLDSIPDPLRDRMEIIRLAGYDVPEKMKIARDYLEPKVREQAGLAAGGTRVPPALGLSDSAIESLIRWYCREAGVRNLQQHIEKVFRKVALRVLSAAPEDMGSPKWTITDRELADYVGKPVFTSDRLYEGTPPGVTMGLAWTALGGSALYIETTFTRKPSSPSGSLTTTGRMGDVMQESSSISLSFAKRKLGEMQPENRFFFESDVHLHVPEGATPKDGPSAGVTMVTSLISLATGTPVAPDLAMTGEISLTGKVLPVGGIKEKVIAARRANVHTVLLPAANRRDYEELPDYLKSGLTVYFAATYEDVMAVALPSISQTPLAKPPSAFVPAAVTTAGAAPAPAAVVPPAAAVAASAAAAAVTPTPAAAQSAAIEAWSSLMKVR